MHLIPMTPNPQRKEAILTPAVIMDFDNERECLARLKGWAVCIHYHGHEQWQAWMRWMENGG